MKLLILALLICPAFIPARETEKIYFGQYAKTDDAQEIWRLSDPVDHIFTFRCATTCGDRYTFDEQSCQQRGDSLVICSTDNPDVRLIFHSYGLIEHCGMDQYKYSQLSLKMGGAEVGRYKVYCGSELMTPAMLHTH